MTADLFQWLWNILRVHAVPLLLFVALALLIESPLIGLRKTINLTRTLCRACNARAVVENEWPELAHKLPPRR